MRAIKVILSARAIFATAHGRSDGPSQEDINVGPSSSATQMLGSLDPEII